MQRIFILFRLWLAIIAFLILVFSIILCALTIIGYIFACFHELIFERRVKPKMKLPVDKIKALLKVKAKIGPPEPAIQKDQNECVICCEEFKDHPDKKVI